MLNNALISFNSIDMCESNIEIKLNEDIHNTCIVKYIWP